MIGQLENGMNKIQSSCIFHTLEEARGCQTLNGGTINIITRQDEVTTVEIVDVCPEMKELHWRTRRMRDELEPRVYASNASHTEVCSKIIVGQKRLTYQELKVIEEPIKCTTYKMFEESSDDYTILKEYDQLASDYAETYDDDEVFDNTIWGDTYEITNKNKN